jgi:hypothetical protein
VDFGVRRSQKLFAGEDVVAFEIAAERQHRRVLEQEGRVADSAGLAGGDDALLEVDGFGEGYAA